MNEGAERAIERRLDGRAVLINTHKHRCGPTLRCEEAPQHPKPCFWDRPTTSADEPRQSRPRREVDPLTRLNQTDPPRDRQTHRERTYLADRRLGSPLVLHGAAEVGLCVGCDGGRGGSRPSRLPHGHARAARGAAKVALHGGSGRQRSRNLMVMRTTTSWSCAPEVLICTPGSTGVPNPPRTIIIRIGNMHSFCSFILSKDVEGVPLGVPRGTSTGT